MLFCIGNQFLVWHWSRHDLKYSHSIVIISYEKCPRMKLADKNAVCWNKLGILYLVT